MFKKWDYIIITLLMILSVIPEVIFGIITVKDYNSTYAEVTVEGKLYKRINLTNSEYKLMELEGNSGKNIIEVNKNRIGIVEAECPDKICMNPKYIEKPGESVVCLPNRVMIQIKGDMEEDIIISH